MGKYKSHKEFGSNAPINWREKATSESYLKGLSRIAPPNMTPREQRGKRFEERTTKPESAKWHHNYDIAMFGGTEVSPPPIEPKQMALEEKLDGITRIPHVKRR